MREVDGIVRYLSTPSVAQLEWGKKASFNHMAHATTRTRWCSECGGIHLVKDVKECHGTVICPHCGARLAVWTDYARKIRRTGYYSVLTNCKDWTVLRTFLMTKAVGKGEAPVYSRTEVQQQWFKDGVAKVIRELPCNGFNYYCDYPFRLFSELTFKEKEFATIEKDTPLYPIRRVAKGLKKYAINGDFHGLSVVDVLSSVLSYDKAETLWKAGQYAILGRSFAWGMYRENIESLWPSLKICLRRGYIIQNADIWIDYIKTLRDLGLDVRNAHYVCPENLTLAHDRMIERKHRKEERELLAKISEQNTEYVSRIERFKNLDMRDGEIEVSVIPTINEVKREGDLLHHCIFKLEYYNRKSSLLLSARVNGERTESIEFDLHSFCILQCHGDHNNSSPYHDRIIKLVNKNIPAIRRCAKAVV